MLFCYKCPNNDNSISIGFTTLFEQEIDLVLPVMQEIIPGYSSGVLLLAMLRFSICLTFT
jgi:hypothetical protein